MFRLLRRIYHGYLYRHIPREFRGEVLLRTSWFDRIGPIAIPSQVGDKTHNLSLYYFVSNVTGREYMWITKNKALEFLNPYIRISSNCFFGFVTNSRRCDCKWQFDKSLELLCSSSDNDFVIVFAHDDHGKNIEGRLRGHALLYALGQAQNQELISEAYIKNGFSFESREYEDIHIMLKSLGITKMKLLTNNPARLGYFVSKGYSVEAMPLEKPYDPYLSEELGVKKEKLKHLLNLQGFQRDDVEIYGLPTTAFDVETRDD